MATPSKLACVALRSEDNRHCVQAKTPVMSLAIPKEHRVHA